VNLDAVFKAYDIRGTVPDQIDGDLCRRVGAAFARFAGAPAVVVGHDMRPSGVELVEAFLEGVTSQGVDAVELGLASTDLLYFASGRLDMPGAVLTASHNPAEYNGIKLCGPGAAPIGVDSGLGQIRADVEAGLEPAAAVGTRSSRDLLPDYVEHVRAFAAPDALSGLKVVADTANGMGGLVVPAVFAGLPVELDLLYGELDGTFPNHPADPIAAENLVDLQARVRETGADLGLAFDGDADRVFLVDERAEPISGSAVTAMVARGLLDRNPGATILYNLICSKAVPEIVAENGGTAVRTKVGHSYIKAMMAETGAVFGGEHSGHYYFRDNFRADSGLIASMVILEQLGRAGVPMSELRRPFERYPSSGEINSRVSDAPAVIEQVAARYSDLAQDRLDGLTVDGGDWWCNLRASNTEPLLRLNVEADDEALLAARRDELLSLIRGESR
jgi:phosphomannomutase